MPINTVVVTLFFQFPPGSVTCASIDPAAAAAFVLQRAQTLAEGTGRTFAPGPAPTCTDAPAPTTRGRHLLQTTQAVLVTKVVSTGPVPPGDATAAAGELARTMQSTVQTTLVTLLETAVTKPGFDAAAAAGSMDTQLSQVELDGQPLLSSPPPPVVQGGRLLPQQCLARRALACLQLWHVCRAGRFPGCRGSSLAGAAAVQISHLRLQAHPPPHHPHHLPSKLLIISTGPKLTRG